MISRGLFSPGRITNCRDKSPYTLWDESFFCMLQPLTPPEHISPEAVDILSPATPTGRCCRVNTRCAETNSLRGRAACRKSDSSSRPSDEILRGFRRRCIVSRIDAIASRYFFGWCRRSLTQQRPRKRANTNDGREEIRSSARSKKPRIKCVTSRTRADQYARLSKTLGSLYCDSDESTNARACT